MAINSDKQLRDKLSNQEFPFDPQAWEQMQALLDKKKKRRGFFWWWTGGLAAVLLLSVGTLGWGLYLMEEDDKQMEEIAAVRNTEFGVRNSKVNAGTTSLSEQETQDGNTKSEIRNTKLNRATATLNEPSNANRQLSTANKKQKRENRNSTYETRNAKLNTANATLNEPSTANRQLSTANSKPETAFTQQEGFILSRQEASLLASRSDNTETAFDKKEEDALPKQKKKIFNYSLGVLTNVSGTTLGKQTNLFDKTPSYAAGLTHDFLFVNRVALTNSVLFAQTSFTVYQPKAIDFAKTPLSYTSHIISIDIPVGIKVYPVVKGNFRFYINTGIVNHIKLKETFTYVPAPDTVYNANVIPPNTNFPDQTNFNGVSADVLSTTGSNSTADFSINRAKRYYASYYASAGFEYLAGGHWLIFGEPTFNMSLQKIGVQDKRKYNIGLNAGLRYTF
ncbi:MAG: hypothetical protein U0T74_06240 [Chitinophagales bacterium]